ncbi:MAG: FMN-binding protein [Sedimentisphaerales bacterium]|nr:FMN-binding protein [Sedimentisphaerales bacterium]
MKNNIRIIIFALILSVISAGLLTGMKIMTSSRQEANKLAFQRANILQVVNIITPGNLTAAKINELFEANIITTQFRETEVYKYMTDGKVQAVILPFAGPGLWNKIKGYLALDETMTTIKGITFYEHEETPGLGGEIEQAWFREQFVDKPFKNSDGKLAITIVKPGMKKNQSDIDGISGATITGDKVQDMLADLCQKIK